MVCVFSELKGISNGFAVRYVELKTELMDLQNPQSPDNCNESSMQSEPDGDLLKSDGTSIRQASQRQDTDLSDQMKHLERLAQAKAELSKRLPSPNARDGDDSSSAAASRSLHADAHGADTEIKETLALPESTENDDAIGGSENTECLDGGSPNLEGEDTLARDEEISALQQQLQDLKDRVAKVFQNLIVACPSSPNHQHIYASASVNKCFAQSQRLYESAAVHAVLAELSQWRSRPLQKSLQCCV